MILNDQNIINKNTIQIIREVQDSIKEPERFLRLIAIRTFNKHPKHYKKFQRYIQNQKILLTMAQGILRLHRLDFYERKLSEFEDKIKQIVCIHNILLEILYFRKTNNTKATNLSKIFEKVELLINWFNQFYKTRILKYILKYNLSLPKECNIYFDKINIDQILKLQDEWSLGNINQKTEAEYKMRNLLPVWTLVRILNISEKIKSEIIENSAAEIIKVIKEKERIVAPSQNLIIWWSNHCILFGCQKPVFAPYLYGFVWNFIEHISNKMNITCGKESFNKAVVEYQKLPQNNEAINWNLPQSTKEIKLLYNKIMIILDFFFNKNQKSEYSQQNFWINPKLELIIVEFKKCGLAFNISPKAKAFLTQWQLCWNLSFTYEKLEKEKLLLQMDMLDYPNKERLIRLVFGQKYQIMLQRITQKTFGNKETLKEFIQLNPELRKYIRKRPKIQQKKGPYHETYTVITKFKKFIKQWERYKSIGNQNKNNIVNKLKLK